MKSEKAGRPLVVGLGCERGTAPDEVLKLVETAIRAGGLEGRDIALVASLDTRAAEPAMLSVARRFSVPFTVFDAARLEAETPRLASPSAVVFAHTGCHGVAEAAALAAVGAAGRLVVPKTKSAHATAAIAESLQAVAALSSQTDSGSSCDESAPAVSREATV
ncbi:cobalamin biosynthesis protein [Rhizobium alarense]|uniref:cobalamin biosynthesis protein n=1 Tax=Rhizobium alarense TaxID=2846851 RepID=UPI0038B4867E